MLGMTVKEGLGFTELVADNCMVGSSEQIKWISLFPCYRLPSQDDDTDELYIKEQGYSSRSTTLKFMGDFNFPGAIGNATLLICRGPRDS